MPFPAVSKKAPQARKIALSLTRHGKTRVDEYAWLRAGNWQEVMRDPGKLDEAIRRHLEAENAHVEAAMAGTAGLQQEIVAEMRGRIREDDSSPPMRDGPYWYATRFQAGAEHPQFVRSAGRDGAAQVVLDGNVQARGKAFFRLGAAGHSPDHRWFAWASDEKGSEYYTVRFRDTDTGRDLPAAIADTAGGGVFSADSRSFLYTRLDANHRPSKVLLHRIGDSGPDRLVWEEADPGKFLGVGKTHSGRLIVLESHDHDTAEAWLIPADDPGRPPQLVAAATPGIEYSIEEANGILYILTNRDQARDFKIATAEVGHPQPDHWRDLVVHKPGRLILDIAAFARHLVRLERENGLPRIVIRRIADGAEHDIAFDEEAYSLGLIGSLEFDTDIIRFSYSSPTTPARIFDYDMESRQRVLVKQQEVPSGHDPAAYVTRRIFAPARDGERIPVTLLMKAATPRDGSAPCLLYGYGSYGITVPAAFDTNILSLVDRGFVHAVAHVRGGKDKGYAWYEAGRLDRKMNTFNDFVDAATFLAGENYTSRGKIVALGRSAGGMLVGAAANLAPELFGGIAAEVPFVDVLNTMLDDTLPLTPPEWGEWGNPIDSAAAYETIASYSPYDNVAARTYPPILAVAGLTDPRVTYWEPAKWIAKLRACKTGDAPVLLKTHMDAGHAGNPGRFSKLGEYAFTYAFAIRCVADIG
jgi:oligopeptidase B